MHFPRRVFVLLTAIVAVGLFATSLVHPIPADTAPYTVQSKLWIEGTSTVRDWVCKKAPVSTEFDTVPFSPNSTEALYETLRDLPDDRLQPTLVFPVKKIRCAQGETMNGHMRNALEVKTYPEITFRVQTLAETDLVDTPTRSVTLNATGDLTIKETTKTVTVPLRATVDETGTIQVKGTLPLDMTKYGVTPPTVMWTITVYDTIMIHTNFVLKPQ